jgi:hypothetical protein
LPPHGMLSLKWPAESTERILKAVREKKQITYKCKPKNHSRFLNRNLKREKGMEWGISGIE